MGIFAKLRSAALKRYIENDPASPVSTQLHNMGFFIEVAGLDAARRLLKEYERTPTEAALWIATVTLAQQAKRVRRATESMLLTAHAMGIVESLPKLGEQGLISPEYSKFYSLVIMSVVTPGENQAADIADFLGTLHLGDTELASSRPGWGVSPDPDS